MNILIVGSGGREHALALKIKSSPHCKALFAAPGNPGMTGLAENINVPVEDMEGILHIIRTKSIDIVVVGPEMPLVAGLSNYISSHAPEVLVIGPKAKGALLEGSKSFAKSFMMRHGIPTAAYLEVTKDNLEEGLSHLERNNPPFVLKADGLAAGKGVLIIDNVAEAKEELSAMLSGKFGDASSVVVIEEFLSGIEFSVFVLTDGKDYILLPEAKDYKRIGVGDTGLNTGGMGAVSPVPFVSEELMKKVTEKIIKPTVAGLGKEKLDYVGFVFFGLINVDGEPIVIEYNCRLGDPETEVVLPRLESDLVEAFIHLKNGSLSQYETKISPLSAATIVCVSGGYPEHYEKGKVITGIETVEASTVFHSGTAIKNGQLVSNGGRVLAITSMEKSFTEAVELSKNNAEKINFEGKYFRTDIGFDL